MKNNRKPFRYTLWMGLAPVLSITLLVMAMTIMVYRAKTTTIVEPTEPVKNDTVYVEKEVIRYIDTPERKPAPKPVVRQTETIVAAPKTTPDTTANN